MSFHDARIEELPPWLKGPEAQGYEGALGDAQDGELADLKVAVVERLATICDPAALDAIGVQYAIERFPGEDLEVYRGRILVAWETWADAGTRAAIIESLNAYGVAVEVYGNRV